MASVGSRFLRKVLALLRERSEPLVLDSFEARRSRIEARSCRVGARARGELLAQCGLHITEALGQRNLARTNVVAAAAFDAIQQAVGFEGIEIAGQSVPVQLLRQEHCGAGF